MEYRMSTIKLALAMAVSLATIAIGVVWVETIPNNPKIFLLFAAGAMASLWLAQKGRETL
jgi:hypothetical protein